MKYRKLCFIFAFATVYASSNNQIKSELDLLMVEDLALVDEDILVRRGVIAELASILEGVASVTEDVLNVVLIPIKQLIKLDQETILENPHKYDIAKVREGGPLCREELAFRKKRFQVVKDAQEKLLGIELEDEDVLEIAFSGSGGSMRAKTFSLGACVGADRIGLLDTVMCMAGLSGTTWFLAPWISSGKPLRDYRKRAIKDITNGLDIDDIDDLEPMLDSLWTKFAFDHHINIIDFFGGLLGNNLLEGFEKSQHMVYLSDQKENIKDGKFPLPIYTAVLGENDLPKHWFEFTPFEIGSRWLKAYIPSWSFGRRFEKGESQSFAPEVSLGFIMGLCGSAFAATFNEAYDRCFKNIRLPKFLNNVPFANKIFEMLKNFLGKVALSTEFGDIRFAWAEVFNYVYSLEENVHKDYKDLKLVDAGLNFNNPIFATYRKPLDDDQSYGGAPDIIFAFDATDVVGTKEIRLSEEYAQALDLKFPKIDNDDVFGNSITIYGDIKDLDTPIIVYMPRTSDESLFSKDYSNHQGLQKLADRLRHFDVEDAVYHGFAFSGNFKYTREQAKLMSGLGEFNVMANKEKIKKILRARVKAKRNSRS